MYTHIHTHTHRNTHTANWTHLCIHAGVTGGYHAPGPWKVRWISSRAAAPPGDPGRRGEEGPPQRTQGGGGRRGPPDIPSGHLLTEPYLRTHYIDGQRYLKLIRNSMRLRTENGEPYRTYCVQFSVSVVLTFFFYGFNVTLSVLFCYLKEFGLHVCMKSDT